METQLLTPDEAEEKQKTENNEEKRAIKSIQSLFMLENLMLAAQPSAN